MIVSTALAALFFRKMYRKHWKKKGNSRQKTPVYTDFTEVEFLGI